MAIFSIEDSVINKFFIGSCVDCKCFLLHDNDIFVSVLHVAARNHVNRMCLAADVPLVESGTAGYLGQATVIKKVLSY